MQSLRVRMARSTAVSGPIHQPDRSPWLAVALLSAAALGYEILLTRLFAIVYWDHLAHMVISLALLGYGASGTFLALAGKRLKPHFAAAFIVHVALFAVLAPWCFALAQSLPFNPLELAWEPANWWWFGAIFLLLSLPFLVAANAIALALWQNPDRIHRVYAADLAGAGGGAIGIVAMLFWLPPGEALRGIVVIALVCTLVAAWQTGQHRRKTLAFAIAGFCTLWLLPSDWMTPRPSSFKALSHALDISGAAVVAEASNPLGQITVVRNDKVPFRLAPGMSLLQGGRTPPQLGLFQDAELAGPVTRQGANFSNLDYLDALPSALPYHLLSPPKTEQARVFLPRLGTGEGVLQAKHSGLSAIEVAEQDPALRNLLAVELTDWTGDLLDGVKIHPLAPRAFFPDPNGRYDLIQVLAPGIDSAGLGALGANYDLTLDAFVHYFEMLAPEGMMAITHPLQAPPRAVPRLILTAIETLLAADLEPARHLVVIRAFRTATIVLTQSPITANQVDLVRKFTEDRGFDLVYLPGQERAEANRFNLLPEPVLFDLTQAMLQDPRHDTLVDYRFRIDPVNDDHPFVYHGIRLSSLKSWWAGTDGAAQMEWGYLILVATLVQATVLSLLLILFPVLMTADNGRPRSVPRFGVLLYFGAVGLAFLFVEIALIHALQRLLHDPMFAVSAVLSSFLIFAGIGSRLAPACSLSIQRRFKSQTPWPLFIGIALTASILLAALPWLVGHLAAWPLWSRFGVAMMLVAPLALLMGMPFPLGLALVTRHVPDRLPLAWAVNGCLSVIAALAAQVTALAIGFNGTLVIGVLVYLAAAAIMPRMVTRTA